MGAHTTSRIVTFTRPFRLSAVPYRLPAGSYTIETGTQGYRPNGTFLRLPLPAGAAGLAPQIMIDPADLEAALARDVAPEPYGPDPHTPEPYGPEAIADRAGPAPTRASAP